MKECKFCYKPLEKPTNPNIRNYAYCNKVCRGKYYYQKNGGALAQREYYYKVHGGESDEKMQCLICSKWFRQVGTHIVQSHKMTAREYREEMGLDVKRGLTRGWYRQLKGDATIENGTVENLKAGKKFWFKLGDERAGRYQRSLMTLERLHNLHKLKEVIHYGNKI